jgi:hypothetical protein
VAFAVKWLDAARLMVNWRGTVGDIISRKNIIDKEKVSHNSHTTKKWCNGKQCCVVPIGLRFEPTWWQIIFATFRHGASGFNPCDGKLFLLHFDRVLVGKLFLLHFDRVLAVGLLLFELTCEIKVGLWLFAEFNYVSTKPACNRECVATV